MIETRKFNFIRIETTDGFSSLYIKPKIIISNTGNFLYCTTFRKSTKFTSQWFGFCYYNFRFGAFTSASYTANINENYASIHDVIYVLKV